jgi:hypothetical protein
MAVLPKSSRSSVPADLFLAWLADNRCFSSISRKCLGDTVWANPLDRAVGRQMPSGLASSVTLGNSHRSSLLAGSRQLIKGQITRSLDHHWKQLPHPAQICTSPSLYPLKHADVVGHRRTPHIEDAAKFRAGDLHVASLAHQLHRRQRMHRNAGGTDGVTL